MSSPIRIGVIGAGSAQFCLSLIKDLSLTDGLAGSQVCLMDLDGERLAVTLNLATRYAAEMGADLRLEGTTSRAVCIQDADFVINTAYVRGHEHEWVMRDIAAQHGYYYDGVQLGDYYQHKLALDIAREMEVACPDAWLLQVANPVFNCTTLITRETSIKTCGLCHGINGYRDICTTIGLDPDRVTIQAAGFNHNIWLTHFIHEGKDVYPMIDEWIRTKAEEYWSTFVASHTHDSHMSRAAVHLYDLYGLFPVGDTYRRVGAGPTVGCTVYRGEWWLHTDLETKKYWFGEPWGGPDTVEGRRWFDQTLRDRMARLTALANDPKAKLVEALGGESTEPIIPLVDALANDHERPMQVNVPNNGSIKGIPDDVVVEVPAIISGRGIQPLYIGALPPKLMLEALLPHWLDLERNLLAFKTGDRSILLWNALDSHQSRSYEQASRVVEELLAVDGHEEMNAHFKPSTQSRLFKSS